MPAGQGPWPNFQKVGTRCDPAKSREVSRDPTSRSQGRRSPGVRAVGAGSVAQLVESRVLRPGQVAGGEPRPDFQELGPSEPVPWPIFQKIGPRDRGTASTHTDQRWPTRTPRQRTRRVPKARVPVPAADRIPRLASAEGAGARACSGSDAGWGSAEGATARTCTGGMPKASERRRRGRLYPRVADCRGWASAEGATARTRAGPAAEVGRALKARLLVPAPGRLPRSGERRRRDCSYPRVASCPGRASAEGANAQRWPCPHR